MKLSIIIIFLAAFMNNVFAQSSGKISASQVASWITKPVTFTSVSDAKTMIAEIIEVIGIKQNFEVMTAKVDNAAAVVYQSKRYILFNPDFINRLDAAAGNKWASVSILAHEVGHHIQNLNGTAAKVNNLRGQVSETEFNRYSVKMELQADFLAGVWAHHTQKMKNILDPGDIEEALNAANAIGDDNLQKQTTGRVVPDAFTHGTSAQRIYWFKKGFTTGDINQGDTFNDPSL